MGLIQRALQLLPSSITGAVPPAAHEDSDLPLTRPRPNILTTFARNMFKGILQGNVPPVWDGASFLAAYSASPWLRATTDKMAYQTATTQWYVKGTKDKDGKRVKAELMGNQRARMKALAMANLETDDFPNHPLVKLLAQPCPYLPGIAVKMLWQIYIDIVGEAFFVIEREGGDGPPIALYPVPPYWVRTIPRPGMPYYWLQWRTLNMKIPPSGMYWDRTLNPTDPYHRGSGLMMTLGDELAAHENASKLVNFMAYNRARPDLLVSLPNFDEEKLTEFKDKWQGELRGISKTGKAFFTNTEAKVEKLATDFVHMQLFELQGAMRDVIRQTPGIPPEILGITESSNRACHSTDTECLTKDGWKLHEALSLDDEIATWNEPHGRMEFERPSKIVRYDYAGEMHHWSTRSVDVLVTPDHRMFVKSQFAGAFEIRRSHELADKKLQMVWRATGGGVGGLVERVDIPNVEYVGHGKRGGEPDGDGYNVPARAFAPFLGHWIAEGSVSDSKADQKITHNSYGVRLHQNVGASAETMRASMDALGMGPVGESIRYPNEGNLATQPLLTLTVSNKSLWCWLMQHVGSGAENKRLPRCVFDWSYDARLALLQGLMLGDGSRPQARTKSKAAFADRFYSTSSKGLADDVQELCVGLGLRSSIGARSKGEFVWYVVGISSKQCVYVSTSLTGKSLGNPSPLTVEGYDGIVWCVEVPNHLFFTRRNGRVTLHGNTIDAADYIMAKHVIEPRLERQREFLNTHVVPEFDSRILLEYESPVEMDKAFTLQTLTAMPAGARVNDWRKLAGLDPLDKITGGELFVVTMGASLKEALLEPEAPEVPLLPGGPGPGGGPAAPGGPLPLVPGGDAPLALLPAGGAATGGAAPPQQTVPGAQPKRADLRQIIKEAFEVSHLSPDCKRIIERHLRMKGKMPTAATLYYAGLVLGRENPELTKAFGTPTEADLKTLDLYLAPLGK